MKTPLSFLTGLMIGGLCVFYWTSSRDNDDPASMNDHASLPGKMAPSRKVYIIKDLPNSHTEEIPWLDSMTLLDSIAATGGTTERITEMKVFRNGSEATFTFQGRQESDPSLQPGDIVMVR